MRQNIIPIMPIVENPTKVRVAAYVRVSTSKDDQLNSFAAQYIHYKKLFEDSTYEELIDIYSDEDQQQIKEMDSTECWTIARKVASKRYT